MRIVIALSGVSQEASLDATTTASSTMSVTTGYPLHLHALIDWFMEKLD
jgi:hypothetical protein